MEEDCAMDVDEDSSGRIIGMDSGIGVDDMGMMVVNERERENQIDAERRKRRHKDNMRDNKDIAIDNSLHKSKPSSRQHLKQVRIDGRPNVPSTTQSPSKP